MELKKITNSQRLIQRLETMGISSVEALLDYYPFRYEVMQETPVAQWNINDTITCEGTILRRGTLLRLANHRTMTLFSILCQSQEFQVTLFNRPWVSQFQPGKIITLIGKYNGKSRITASQYYLKPLAELAGIHPVYNLKEGIKQNELRRLIQKAYSVCGQDIATFLPSALLHRYRLCSRRQAIAWIHFPHSMEEVKQALRHLKYEEFFRFQLVMQAIHLENKEIVKGNAKQFSKAEVLALEKSLPFTLTDGQKQAIQEILDDLSGEHLMYRMLQGDVGCGKTMVAAFGLYACVLAHKQGALLAPTEILARQHCENLQQLFKDHEVRVALLCSSLKPAQKKIILEELANNTIDIIVGTHALFQEDVHFYDLGMVVADEQHRFGVTQRRQLLEKGEKVDFLLMSATPIPRTLAQSLFGDMDVSIISHLPKGRMPIETHFVPSSSMGPVLEQVLQLVDQGDQCYVVCPAIEKNEEMPLRNVLDIYEGMQRLLGKRYTIALLHGRMSGEEKQAIMEAFLAKKIQFLISTTVIEVGIDVKSANVMVIYDAHRFGLSTIHQLRGRVGRGKRKGYCYLLSATQDPQAIERLKMLEKLQDGFAISQYDLQLRGPGDLLGTRQSGVPGFVLANVISDGKMLEAARTDAAYVLSHLEDAEYRYLHSYIQEALKKAAYID
ncbi:ATP-dependent DNA helicase RecG [Merdibacter massiliensis]|uniref:ATP-dependent DNA helicase RecG n=1 Tax=Merdibacter massiliensis TaxID=1871030 RepID=UPI00096A53B1|nr:ATP-dependent DNA helicase RecG [Merdibacter massiliensis]